MIKNAMRLILSISISVALYEQSVLGGVREYFEFDGLPSNCTENEFLKKRPEATMIYQTAISKAYLYIVKEGLQLEGSKVVTSARDFENDKGCAIGIGFQPSSQAEINQLVDRLRKSYKSSSDAEPLGDTNQVIYLESEGFFASIVFTNAVASKRAEITYAVSDKSCGVEVAHRWQTLPR
jgi:hypothetical protein